VDFNAYLVSKKIDPDAFRRAEPLLWESWCAEFEKVSPASFTMQKLFLINPIRRKYKLSPVADPAPPKTVSEVPGGNPEPAVAPKPAAESPPVKKPAVAKPVMRPKPKIQ
jgi:hypothetical protein